jgi:hypothetical protein
MSSPGSTPSAAAIRSRTSRSTLPPSTLPPLELADRGLANAGPIGEGLLAEAAGLAKLPDPKADGGHRPRYASPYIDAIRPRV